MDAAESESMMAAEDLKTSKTALTDSVSQSSTFISMKKVSVSSASASAISQKSVQSLSNLDDAAADNLLEGLAISEAMPTSIPTSLGKTVALIGMQAPIAADAAELSTMQQQQQAQKMSISSCSSLLSKTSSQVKETSSTEVMQRSVTSVSSTSSKKQTISSSSSLSSSSLTSSESVDY